MKKSLIIWLLILIFNCAEKTEDNGGGLVPEHSLQWIDSMTITDSLGNSYKLGFLREGFFTTDSIEFGKVIYYKIPVE